MCIACSFNDTPPKSKFGQFSYGGMRLKNFIPRPRGEVNPAPWIAWQGKKYGFSIEASRIRYWTEPEFYRGHVATSIMWGFFHVAWRN